MMHTIVEFLKYRSLIFQNIAHFSTCKIPLNDRNLNKTADVKIRGNFQYFGSFLRWPGCSTLYTSIKSLIGAKMSK